MENDGGHRRHLYFTAIIVSLGYSSVGCVFSWTSPTLPRLMAKDSWLPITEEQGSWIASIMAIGGTIGPLLSGKLLDCLGRKWTLILAALLLIISWIVLALASCVEILYGGRIISGFSTALMFMALILYIAEISDEVSRGMLSSTSEFSLAIGFNLQYFAGPYLSYKMLIVVSVCLPILFILLFIWLPESPHYLIAKGKKEESIKSLRWFRGNIPRDCAEKEIVIIESTMYEMIKKKESFWTLMKVTGNQKALGIACFLMAAQQFSGINVIQLYSEMIFMYSGTKLKPAYCSMIVGTFQLISSGLAAPLTKKFGFKTPLLIASILITIEHFVMGLFFYLLKTGRDVSSIDWIPVVCMVLYILTYSAISS
ncbi:facilitated trehalose transporter Tret1-like isoform X2 [Lycorma delicatula]|uniref:facilitated trehalose transporter Tret1-like isoform X2 n=1 Tax=Lycorma delicatula TaxID=130591 RepID=UPI003F51839B